MSNSFKAVDSKKEEFRKYLEKTGVLDALTKMFVCLYQEPNQPQNAIDFLMKYLKSDNTNSNDDVFVLKDEIDFLNKELEDLLSQNNQLKERLSKYEQSVNGDL